MTKVPFRVTQIFITLLGCLAYMLVFFYRYTPTVLTPQLAESLNVTEDKISVFGSMYFWTYALMQPVGGVLSDVFSPGKLISISTIISGIGSIIMGQSKNFWLSCFARCLVGIGCGPIFVPVTRLLANWYSPKGYATANGFLLALGAAGGCLAQGPLSSLCEIIDWRWAFRISTILGVLIAILCFFFMKTTPSDFGYDEYQNLMIDQTPIGTPNLTSMTDGTDNNNANKTLFMINNSNYNTNNDNNNNLNKVNEGKVSAFKQLLLNLKVVLQTKQFYVFVMWDLFSPPCFYNLTALWASRYIVDVIKIDKKNADYWILSLSFAMIIGSPIWPIISNLSKSRKLIFTISTAIAFLTSIGFIFINRNVNSILIIAMLFLFAAGSNANITLLNSMVKETNHKVAATMLGCANFFPFFATGILQIVSPLIINWAEKGSSENFRSGDSHSARAYQYGLWLVNAVFTGIALVVTFFIKDTFGNKPEKLVYN